MYARGEASKIKHEFWTTFGRYMSPVLSAEGITINWVNYHTGIKDVFFRMDAFNSTASVAISIEHNDADIRDLFFEQFVELKPVLAYTVGEDWIWRRHDIVLEKPVSRIFTELPGVSVFNKEHWPALISFFKHRIIALDAFWENAKYSFDALR